jgi:hypothetical protein
MAGVPSPMKGGQQTLNLRRRDAIASELPETHALSFPDLVFSASLKGMYLLIPMSL